MAREIDYVFYSMGFDEIVPPVVRYVLALTVCCMPIILVIVLLCCCSDDCVEEEEIVQINSPKLKSTSPKKNEKID